jgi:hypothetical protein
VSITVKARPDTTHGSWVASVKCVNGRKKKLEFRGIPLEKFTLVSKTPAQIEWKPVEIGHCEHKDPETGKVETLWAIVEAKPKPIYNS